MLVLMVEQRWCYVGADGGKGWRYVGVNGGTRVVLCWW